MTLCVGGALDGMDSNDIIAGVEFHCIGSFVNHDAFTYKRDDGMKFVYIKDSIECFGSIYFVFTWQHRKINPIEYLIQGYKK